MQNVKVNEMGRQKTESEFPAVGEACKSYVLTDSGRKKREPIISLGSQHRSLNSASTVAVHRWSKIKHYTMQTARPTSNQSENRSSCRG